MTDILSRSMCVSSYEGIVERRQIAAQSAVRNACRDVCDIAKERNALVNTDSAKSWLLYVSLFIFYLLTVTVMLFSISLLTVLRAKSVFVVMMMAGDKLGIIYYGTSTLCVWSRVQQCHHILFLSLF